MIKVNKKKYKILNDITKQQLLDAGFKFIFPDEFVYRTSCYKYKKKEELIFLEFTIMVDMNNGEIENPVLRVNCKNKDGSFYIPFYNGYYTTENNLVLQQVYNALENELNKFIKKKIVVRLHKKHRQKHRKQQKFSKSNERR